MRSPQEGDESSEDELERESSIAYPIRTIRRLFLTIANPLRAMSYVAYDPDLLIVAVIFIIYALFSFLQPMVMISKMDISSDLMLYTPKISIGDFKTDLQRYLWGLSLTTYMISMGISLLVLLIISKIILRDVQIKSIVSGSMYASVVFMLIGVFWLFFYIILPSVAIPYKLLQNETFIVWPSGKIEIQQPNVLHLRMNSSILEPIGVVKEINWVLSSFLTQDGNTYLLFNHSGEILIADGTPSMADRGEFRRIQYASGTILDLTTSYLYIGNRALLALPNGSYFEVKPDSNITLSLNFVQSNSWEWDKITFSWAGGNFTIVRPNNLIVNLNLSLPVNAQKNVTLTRMILKYDITEELIRIHANITAPQAGQTDMAFVKWDADSVAAQAESLMIYFNQRFSNLVPEAIRILTTQILPILSRVWYSVILIILLKRAHDVSWIRACIVILIQQAILFLLRF